MSIYQCLCGKEFPSKYSLSAHKGSHQNKAKPFRSKVCVLETKEVIATTNLDHYLSNLVSCHCGKTFNKTKSKYCSSSCATSASNKARGPRSQESKDSTSRSVKQAMASKQTTSKRKDPYKRICEIHFNICSVCQTAFSSRTKRTTCSEECHVVASTKRRSNYFYKGIRMDSSWEVQVAEILDEYNVRWIRPKPVKYLHDIERNYFPDFYLPDYDLYLDPKNEYRVLTTLEKLKSIQKVIRLEYGPVDYLKSIIQNLAGVTRIERVQC